MTSTRADGCLSEYLEMSEQPDIRPYRSTDAADIIGLSLPAWEPVHDSLRRDVGDELFDRLYEGDWRLRQRRDVEAVFAEDGMKVWVAEVTGKVVAFAAAVVREEGRLGEVYMLAVDPVFQCRGLGTTLTNVATEWLRDAGCSVAFISTGGDDGHEPARATYKKAGYIAVPAVTFFKSL
jgi:GNAT superfamily N-acetyltransferase